MKKITLDKEKTRKAYKFQVYPSKAQITRIERHFELLRQLRNWALKGRTECYSNYQETVDLIKNKKNIITIKIKDANNTNIEKSIPIFELLNSENKLFFKKYKEENNIKSSLSQFDQQKLLTEYIQLNPKYQEVYSSCRTYCLIQLDHSYNAFFRRVKLGTEKPGFPKFKQYGTYTSMTRQCSLTSSQNVFIKDKYNFWFSTDIGRLSMIRHKSHKLNIIPRIPKNAELKSMTISKENDKYFVCFSVIENIKKIVKKNDKIKEIGFDFDLYSNVFLYNELSEKVESYKPAFILDIAKDLARIQRRFSKVKEEQKSALKKILGFNSLSQIDFYIILKWARGADLPKGFKRLKQNNKLLREELQKKEKEFKKELQIETKKMNKIYFRLKHRREEFILRIVNHLIKFDHIIINQPDFSEELLPKKDKNEKEKERKTKTTRDYNKLILDATGHKLIEKLKQKADEGKLQLTINKV